MSAVEYKLFFNNNIATQDQLDMVEEITVEQEIDMIWEARLKIPIIVDDKGNWTGQDEDFMNSFSRVRIEVKVGKKSFLPLIDGPIVGFDKPMHSEPGQSFLNLVVNDDSVYLNQKEEIQKFEDMKDDKIATQIFQKDKHIKSTDIETTKQNSPLPAVVQRGTGMQTLRMLARRNGMHAYVLPGDNPGQSIGCFKSFPTSADGGLADLVLLGPDKNMVNFNVVNDSTSPSVVDASYLNMGDKSIVKSESSYSDAKLLGKDQVLDKSGDASLQILWPYRNFTGDPSQIVVAEAVNSGYSIKATGSVFENGYQDVLQPYRIVKVLGVNARESGDYLISKVTHNLTLSSYSQSFTLKRNARSDASKGGDTGSSISEVIS
jgi:hypothetical protein